MPGSTPWARASPMNDSPRTTTQVPTSEVVTRRQQAGDRRARCMNSEANGSVSQRDHVRASAIRSASVRIISR